MSVAPQDFSYFQDFLQAKTGIYISEDKLYLLESRLLPLARKRNLDSIQALIREMRAGGAMQAALIKEITEAMTTNETMFFRDSKPFDYLKNEMMPYIKKHNKSGKLRIWCAACSTGQEPYSIAMTIKENPALFGSFSTVEIIGTDIDTTALHKAEQGQYTQFEVQRGLPIQLLMKYFTQLESYGDVWQLKDDIKKMVGFKQLNLLESYMSLGRFDIIFCRNVLIYFRQETKSDVLNRLSGQLQPYGFLMLGSSENTMGLTDRYEKFNQINGLLNLKAA